MENKYITRKKVGLIILLIGLLLTIITYLVVMFNANILLGIIVLGIIMTIIGGFVQFID